MYYKLIIPSLLDLWVTWYVNGLERRSGSSEDVASLGAVSPAVFSHNPHTTGSTGVGVSPLPASDHSSSVLHKNTQLWLSWQTVPHSPPSSLITPGSTVLIPFVGTTLVAQTVRNLPAVWETQETWVQSLGGEDPLDKEVATQSSIVAWRIPWREAWWAAGHGVTQSQTRLSD